MTAAPAYDQLLLPLPDTTDRLPGDNLLTPARTALATADHHALAAHLAGVAQLRGRTPIPKPGRSVPMVLPGSVRQRLVPTSPELGPVATFHAFVRLISVDSTTNRFRFYVLSWHPTLWGDFALVQTWGRLGRPGRFRTTSYATRAEAQGMIMRLLRRRLRHGYRVIAWT